MSLIMKHLSVAVSVLLISLGAGAQNISLSFSGAPLADVLHAMEEQTDCSFIYETADLNKVSSITIDAKNRSLVSVLNEIIKAPLSYEMKGKIVIISSVKQGVQPQPSTEIRVSGTVMDAANHDPLVGLMVMIKGTTVGTTTDLDGHFSITVPILALIFSFEASILFPST